MKPKRPSRYRSIVTLAQVAVEAGVSIATASLALRGNRRISPGTTKRVRQVAKSLGYMPDPTLRKLMVHLRTRRKSQFQSTICVLHLSPPFSLYEERLLEAARLKGEELGYKLVVEEFPLDKDDAARHQKSLFYRNIEGLLLLPQGLPLDASELYSWDRFSVVCAGFSPVAPDFDRIASNWFYSTKLCISMLEKKGYRRVGFVCGAHYDFMMDHLPTAAAAGASLMGRMEFVPPFLYLPSIDEHLVSRLAAPFRAILQDWRLAPYKNRLHSLPGEFLEWFEREKPDALVSDCEETMRAVARVLGPRFSDSLGRAGVSVSSETAIGGVDQKPEQIGAAAMDLLHKKIAHGSRGVPKNSFVQLFKGQWREPASTSALLGVLPSAFPGC